MKPCSERRQSIRGRARLPYVRIFWLMRVRTDIVRTLDKSGKANVILIRHISCYPLVPFGSRRMAEFQECLWDNRRVRESC